MVPYILILADFCIAYESHSHYQQRDDMSHNSANCRGPYLSAEVYLSDCYFSVFSGLSGIVTLSNKIKYVLVTIVKS